MQAPIPSPDVTICFTIGRRPELLRRTLDSMAPLLAAHPVIAINDFGDAETNAVFRAACPGAELVLPPTRLGHHRALDQLYSRIRTPFLLQCEDDWTFTRLDFLPDALRLLSAEPALSVVCLRALDDMEVPPADQTRIRRGAADGIAYARLDGLHRDWHRFTFNPHVAPLALWQRIGPFARFERERHVSKALRREGRFVAYLTPGACHHIGDGASTGFIAAPDPGRKQPGLLTRMLNRLKG